jgi:ABC-type glutathione transport system ATPase component
VAAEALLRVRDLRIRAGGAELVHGLDFEIAPGESLGLVGASGSGKSLTTLALLGLLPEGIETSGGTVEFGGQAMSQLDAEGWRQVRGARMGLVFQDPASALNPVLRVGDQVAEVLEAHGCGGTTPAARLQRVHELLDEVQIADPASLARRYPHELSGGQRQRVMIAIALAGEPELLLADEPTTALDVTVQAAVLDLVARIQRERGLAMLWISHDLGVIARVCDRVVVMDEGRLAEEGPVEQVLTHPVSEAARRLLAAAPRMRVHVEVDADDAPTALLDTPPAVLTIRELHVRYPAQRDFWGRVTQWTDAVQGVSLQVPRGRTLALVGESGSGKSSLGRAVLRLVPSEGDIWLHDAAGQTADVQEARGAELRALRRRLGVVFQDPARSLNPRLKIGRSVIEPLAIHGVGDRPSRAAQARALLERVELDPDWVDRYPHELSGGQKQRVAIARAIALEPELVICDEAVSALDVAVQKRILELLQALQGEFGTSYLFITHDLAVVEEFAHEVAVMRDGRLVEEGSVAQVFAQPQQSYTQELLAASPRLPAVS